MESVRSLYAFGARLIPPSEGNRGDIRSGCGFVFKVGVVLHLKWVWLYI